MCEPSVGAVQSVPQFNLPAFNQEGVRHILLGDDDGALVEAINRMACWAIAIAWLGANCCRRGVMASSSA